jgi:hypothetical protein
MRDIGLEHADTVRQTRIERKVPTHSLKARGIKLERNDVASRQPRQSQGVVSVVTP